MIIWVIFLFSDESGEELIKAIRLMIFENVFFEGANLKRANLKESNEE